MNGILGVSNGNDFCVSVTAGKPSMISIMNPNVTHLSADEALNLAAWLFCVASMARQLEDRGFDDEDFIAHVNGIRYT